MVEGWEAGCSALHRKAGTPALHPPAVSQYTLPCAPQPIYPVHGARATRFDDESLFFFLSFFLSIYLYLLSVAVMTLGDDSVMLLLLLLLHLCCTRRESYITYRFYQRD